MERYDFDESQEVEEPKMASLFCYNLILGIFLKMVDGVGFLEL